ncbi:MAG: hypothetical protein MUO60_09205, partial [Clostridiaceae bacterium]|nr:hypothetical protein [Clostridiaceae bacterium]
MNTIGMTRYSAISSKNSSLLKFHTHFAVIIYIRRFTEKKYILEFFCLKKITNFPSDTYLYIQKLKTMQMMLAISIYIKSPFTIKVVINNLRIIIITSCIIPEMARTKPNSNNKYFIFF